MSVIQTDSLSIGNLSQLSKDGLISRVIHRGVGFFCNDNDCNNSKLVAKCRYAHGLADERCACLSKSVKCPIMTTNSGNVNGTIYDIQFSPFYVDPGNCLSASDPNWSWVLRDSTQTPIATCQYPTDAIPTDEQAGVLVKNISSKNNRKFLENYCFSQEQDISKCPPPLTSCIKANSRPNICNQLGSSVREMFGSNSKQDNTFLLVLLLIIIVVLICYYKSLN
jgi:hypothetical protein